MKLIFKRKNDPDIIQFILNGDNAGTAQHRAARNWLAFYEIFIKLIRIITAIAQDLTFHIIFT